MAFNTNDYFYLSHKQTFYYLLAFYSRFSYPIPRPAKLVTFMGTYKGYVWIKIYDITLDTKADIYKLLILLHTEICQTSNPNDM